MADEAGTIMAPVRRRGRPAQNGLHSIDEAVLLEEAFRAFAERGYEATTLRNLAKVLGVSHNLINVRFGRKEDLWARAVEWRLTKAALPVTAAFAEEGEAEARLRHLIERFARWAIVNSDIVALTHLEGFRSSWRLDYLVENFIAPFQRRLDALMSEVAAQRSITPVSSAALMALLVQGVGFFFGAIPLQERIGAAPLVKGRRAEEEADRLAGFLLAGLLPAQP